MTSVLRRILPDSSTKNEDHGDEYNLEYSFAIEYNGPPVSHNIPLVVPVDIHGIPTASVAARAVRSSTFSLPVIQPIVKRGKKTSDKLESELAASQDLVRSSGEIRSSGRVDSQTEAVSAITVDGDVKYSVLHDATSSSNSGTLGFSESQCDLNHLSGSSDVEDLDGDYEAGVSYGSCVGPHAFDSKNTPLRSLEICSEVSSGEEEDHYVGETSCKRHIISVVTFHNVTSSDVSSEQSDLDGSDLFPEKPVISDSGKKGLCYRCNRRNRFSDKEICIVCDARYCSKCVLRAMGSMPEGRKCITCIGYKIDESKRVALGKCSRMLKRLLTEEVIEQVMVSEISCDINQFPPHLVCVNDTPLSIEELTLLRNCSNPPKKLKQGKYWYDKVSGLWGKQGEKPCQIISARLAVGGQIRRDASNGNTNVLINDREITKAEIWLLKAADIHYEQHTNFWVEPDGSFQLEGMNNVVGKLWGKRRVKIACAALSLPYPSDFSNPGSKDAAKEPRKVEVKTQEHKLTKKFMLVGCDKSGTSTIFKQAKILYGVPFSEDEKQDIKFFIQRNLYRYISILLEGNELFEEEYSIKLKQRLSLDPGPSEISNQVDDKNIYSLSPKLKAFAAWLLKVMMAGNLEDIFPAATRVYSPLVEELWKDKAVQATYMRRNEIHKLPRAANYFLDRAVELSQVDYEPSELDILHAEGITSSNGVACMKFSFPESPQDKNWEPSDHNDLSISYQLIRVHASGLGENCKWLEMFEDVDLVVYCVSLTDYDEYYEDLHGVYTNKMMANKKQFETIATHPTLVDKDFLLILNKFDLLEEKIHQVPLSKCDWFENFKPIFSYHPHSSNINNNPPLAHRAYHFVAVEFKRLFMSLTEKKLFVTLATGLKAYDVDKALRYGKEILKWSNERKAVVVNASECSSESGEPSTSS